MRILDHRLVHEGHGAVEFRQSPNHGGALSRPRFLVMHYTAGRSADSAAKWLCNPAAKASAHLVIGKDGAVKQLLPFNVVAWHAGKSEWRDGEKLYTGLNKCSIGIELDNPGRLVRQGARWRSLALGTDYDDADGVTLTHKNEAQPSGWHLYPTAQLDAAFEIAQLLVETYGLKDVIGHDDVAPGRKSDPGPAFPMESFRSRLFGRSDDDDDLVVAPDAEPVVAPGIV
jgi:N-acetylmuramoyl-L-alanine amidase